MPGFFPISGADSHENLRAYPLPASKNAELARGTGIICRQDIPFALAVVRFVQPLDGVHFRSMLAMHVVLENNHEKISRHNLSASPVVKLVSACLWTRASIRSTPLPLANHYTYVNRYACSKANVC